MLTTGRFKRIPPVEPKNRRVAEREDAAVARDQPVAATRRRRRHPDDRLVELHPTRGAIELRVPVGEHAPIGRDDPIPEAGDSAVHAHCRARCRCSGWRRFRPRHGPGRADRHRRPLPTARCSAAGIVRGAAGGGGGTLTETKRGPTIRPSRCASVSSKVFTLYASEQAAARRRRRRRRARPYR